jgi:hypothetical protein
MKCFLLGPLVGANLYLKKTTIAIILELVFWSGNRD